MPIGPARMAEPAPGVSVNRPSWVPARPRSSCLPLLLLLPAAWRAAARVPGPLGVAEPDTAGPGFPARRAAGPVRAGDRERRPPDGVRAGARADRGAGPHRAGRHGRGGDVGGRRPGVRGQPAPPGVHSRGCTGRPGSSSSTWNSVRCRAPLVTGVLARQPGLAGYAIGNYGQVTVGGRIVPAIGVAPVRGRGFVTLLAGRPPDWPGPRSRSARRPCGPCTAGWASRSGSWSTGNSGTCGSPAPRCWPRSAGAASTATDLGNGAVLAPPVLSQPNLSSGCPGPVHLLQLRAAAVPARHRPGGGGRRGWSGSPTSTAARPGPAWWSATSGPATSGLRRGAEHPAPARRGTRPAGRRHAHPRAADQRPAAAP